ncbi:MAG: BTAD domain-containing putative transcriptional regulator [Betaproteobacteria bacterium]
MSPSDRSVIAFKTSAPSTTGIVERTALLAKLRGVNAPARWLSAPAGSGKSTLAASYARSAQKLLLWYRIDARDDDPAFFYTHFSAIAADALADGAALPRFSDENHVDEPAYAERFVAALQRALGSPTLVVFDDVHRLTAAARHASLARFAANADATLEVLFVSEASAPASYFDCVASRRLALCNDVELAFDAQECLALATALRLPNADGGELAALTGGHAAALVLACEYLRDAQRGSPSEGVIVGQIHQHLLDKLLQTMPETRRKLLHRTAFAPQLTTALAVDLAGADAAGELEALVASGLLRRAGTRSAPVYEAHGLVRRGMQSLLGASAHEVEAQASRTADALLAHGFIEDAFSLLVERKLFDRAAGVLESLAPRYTRAGQALLLASSTNALPEHLIAARPWVCFWTGQALLAIDEEQARRWFERSYAGFEDAGDRAGMRLAASSVVTAFGLEYGDIRALDAWLERHTSAGGDTAIAPGCEFEAALCLGLMSAARVRGAFPAGIEPDDIVNRVRRFTEDAEAWHSRDQRIQAAFILVEHARVFQTREQSQIMVVATRGLAEDTASSALQRGRWAIGAAYAYFEDAKHDVAASYFAQAQALLEQTKSPRLAFDLTMAHVDADTKRGDLEAAAKRLRALDEIAANAPPGQRAEHARITARVLLLQGQKKEGLRWAGEALHTAELAGFTGSHARVFQNEYVYALAANGNLAEAIERNDKNVADLQGVPREGLSAISDCLRFLHGGARDASLLERGLARAASVGFINLLGRAPELLAQLCDHGLARGIEVDFVRRLIAVNRLSPPDDAGPAWPWAVRVRSLGEFELTINGAPYRPSHKAQDKPLELLKLLVCCHALGRTSADRDWIVERLWPDADVANARKSLDMTVSRLRRLLKSDDAVLSQEGRLGLSPRHVWLDIAPLLRALARVGEHRDALAGGKSTLPAAAADVSAVLSHYRGPFLPEGEAPWIIGGRESVSGAVRSALLAADALLDEANDPGLIPALERALAADPTSEDLARALMLRHGRRGEYGEVLRVYRRLREMLSIVLGLAPSRETELVREKYYSEAHADSASRSATLRS